ncbi:Transmembrane emp24 domain-containing protein p24delta4 [Hibiscus syriacus]|uniref:Transmembrane emp24 domain-containing protein p24delta4 n=1 Tax=Hibiscus syriacus TaxID=106335 RepID=A0A6A2X823_HIBSY|nr:transmembrane emp24 domain-containing protein p24delta3-like [Hibiscus syriacus]KAE8671138.1 Transmembrane emp24 domain-containing protein p24delta4 [Hibiscus syriacus]
MIKDSNVPKAMIFPSLFVILLLCALSSAPVCDAIWLNLPKTGTNYVSEEIHNNVVVLADYVVVSMGEGQSAPIAVKVTSPFGNNLHHRENVMKIVTYGRFAFTTEESGNYLACFWSDNGTAGSGKVVINIDWKTGIATKDWEAVARKEKLQGVELELTKLEGAVEAIHENLLYLKSREAEMVSTSETTNAKVAWFSFMSLGICILVSSLQVWYLKSFFQNKKLI